MPSNSRIILIDAHALCYRAFYAVKDLRNSKGFPTNAVFGFVNILKKLVHRYKPTHIAACFDVGRHTKRKEMFADYKATRVSMPEDLSIQIPVIKDALCSFSIPAFAIDGYEADDIIAVLTHRFADQDHEVIIVSDDKDLHQLLGKGIFIYHSRRDTLLGPDDTKERFGVSPDQMVDYLALAGDTSDNIPGVAGIGEVTAQKLIAQYGSLENLLNHADDLKGKLKDKIIAGRDSALLSRELAQLDINTPVDCLLDDIAWKGINTESLKALFHELEFRLPVDMELKPEAKPSKIVQPVKETFDFMNIGDAPSLIKTAFRTGKAAFLLDQHDNILVSAGDVFFQCPVSEIDVLKDILQSPVVLKIFYDVKSARKALPAASSNFDDHIFDVLLAGFIISAGQSSYSIKALAWTLLGTPIEDDPSPLTEVKLLLALQEPLLNTLHERGLYDLFKNIELPLSRILFEMESEGVKLDTQLLMQLSVDSDKKIAAMVTQLHSLAGEEFNCNSSKQLGHILFEKLKLPSGKKTKTGYSTDEEVLHKLADKHPLPALVLEYRQLSKLKSTYIDALPKLISPRTGKVHCSFNQTGAETGRLSSNSPNLQNIPIRTEEGRMIRKAFIPSSSHHLLLSADYSQIELRLLAHLADEPDLKKAFLNGEDIHTYTAGLIFDVAQSEVTTEMRYNAKRINFGIIYGMSAFGLAKDLGLSQKEAQGFIDRYFLRYPRIQPFMHQEIEKARALGFSETLFHRRRYLPDINSRNPAVRNFAERQAINTPLQGTAADIIKIAMIRIAESIRKHELKSSMIITVHDELVFNVPDKELNKMIPLLKDAMENAAALSIPLSVGVQFGPNWAEMKKVKE